MRFVIIFLLFLISITSTVQSQIVYILDPIVVTGSRLSSGLVSGMREVHRLTKEDLIELPSFSVSGILQYIGGVDLQQRGIDGVQTDFSIRGSAFEQVLVLVDGVRINDPQTGHHNSDFPVSMNDIECVEVLCGQGSSVYGSDSFGGIIHIITKTPHSGQSQLGISGGSFHSFGGSWSQVFSIGSLQNRFHIEKKKSDGHDFDTDSDIFNTSLSSYLVLGKKEIQARFGYIHKDFGANRFYADFPSRETIQGYHGHLNYAWQPNSKFKLKYQIYGRRHDDDFTLDFQQPDIYQAEHTSWSYGSEVNMTYRFNKSTEIAWGIEGIRDELQSNPLGKHDRTRWSCYFETVFPINGQLMVNCGSRGDHYNSRGWIISPTFNVKWILTSELDWRFSTGKAFRIPTFTELYYQSPANIGNPDLKAEQAWSYDTGITWNHNHVRLEGSIFLRDENNRIDWLRQDETVPWQVANLGQISVYGFSLSGRHKMWKNIKFKWDYFYLKNKGIDNSQVQSKYLYNAPNHQIACTAIIPWTKKIHHSIIVNYKERTLLGWTPLLDSMLSIRWKNWRYSFALINIFNTAYEEIPGVVLPGRHIMTDLIFSFSNQN